MKTTSFAHSYWQKILFEGGVVIDATMGNGYDTLALAQILNGKGTIYGYDIQEIAIEKTKVLLKSSLPQEKMSNIFFRFQSHESFLEAEADLIVYNLGYLPGGDKRLTTKVESTINSLYSACHIVKKAISLMCYVGHEEGKKEYEALSHFFRNLPPSEFLVCQHSWLNRHQSPVFFWCEKQTKKEKSDYQIPV